MPVTTEFTDRDASELIRLLQKYAVNYSPDLPQTIPALAEDLVDTQFSVSEQDHLALEYIRTVPGWKQ